MLGSIRGGLQSVRTGSMESPGSGGGGGGVNSVVAGLNIDVDASDPANPIVSLENVVDITTLNASGDVNVVDDVAIGGGLDVDGPVEMNGVSGGLGLLVGDGTDFIFIVHAGGVHVNNPIIPPAGPKSFFVNDAPSFLGGDVTIDGLLNGWSNPGAEFTATNKGLVPPSGGGTANFLRADGIWAAPGGGGGGTVDSVVAGSNIDVDATDPANPIVSLEAVVDITTLNVSGVATVDDLAVVDDATVGGDLAVTGTTNLTGALTVSPGGTTLAQLVVTTDATIQDDLSVLGDSTLDFALIAELNVTTSIDCNDLNVADELIVAGTINGTAAPLTDTLGSNGQNLASTAVISGTNQDYEISGMIVRPNEAVTFSLELNGLATNQEGILFGMDNAGNAFDQTDTLIFIASAVVDGATGKTYFRGRIVQMVGQERMIYLEVMTFLPSLPYTNSYSVRARWNVTTEITGIRIHASTATGLKTGTELRVAKALR